jgi:hypothetical protein
MTFIEIALRQRCRQVHENLVLIRALENTHRIFHNGDNYSRKEIDRLLALSESLLSVF